MWPWSSRCLSMILLLNCGALPRSQQQRWVGHWQCCWRYCANFLNAYNALWLMSCSVWQASGDRLTAGAMHAGRRSSDVEEASFPPAVDAAYPTQAQDEGARGVCMPDDLLTQSSRLPGEWVLHDDPQWQSYYGSQSACPDFARDFDCLVGDGPAEHREHELARLEFQKIFRPNRCGSTCALHHHAWYQRSLLIDACSLQMQPAALRCLCL